MISLSTSLRTPLGTTDSPVLPHPYICIVTCANLVFVVSESERSSFDSVSVHKQILEGTPTCLKLGFHGSNESRCRQERLALTLVRSLLVISCALNREQKFHWILMFVCLQKDTKQCSDIIITRTISTNKHCDIKPLFGIFFGTNT